MTKLAFSRVEENGWHIVKLNGAIVEGSKEILSPMNKLNGSNYIFDFRNIASINTCGIAEWIEFMSEFGPGKNIIYDACSSNIVMLINMVPAFKGSAQVRSLFRTYYCDQCSKTVEMAVIKGENMPENNTLKSNPNIDDEVNCNQCKDSYLLEAEVPAEEFYEFLLEDS